MAFKLPTLRDLSRLITSDLSSFNNEDVANEKLIADGGFGLVYKASFKNKTAVIKKIASESSRDEDLFLKEVKVINSLRQLTLLASWDCAPCHMQ